MLLRHIQTFIWKYDKYFADVVALIPASLHRYSSRLGRMTLPSIWAIALCVVNVIILVGGYQNLAILGFIVVACIPIATVMKLLFRRSRPKTIYAQNMKIKSYSFPSSHAYSATIAGGYLSLVCLALLPHPLGIIVSALLALFIVTIGLSRVHVGAHYPTDVTGAWIFGATVLYFVTQISIP
ncbi:MAG: Phosphoesterase PA-phosphatase related protein [Candidatus Saccharibacteria bacterium]|nr:Phosphoesterase PA-phosphatase related protein [Candidatus Saccharibacteria bacterium]